MALRPVFRRGLQLGATQRQQHPPGFVCRPEGQRLPTDGDLAAADAEKAAEIDHRRPRPPFRIDQHVNHHAHVLARGPASGFTKEVNYLIKGDRRQHRRRMLLIRIGRLGFRRRLLLVRWRAVGGRLRRGWLCRRRRLAGGSRRRLVGWGGRRLLRRRPRSRRRQWGGRRGGSWWRMSGRRRPGLRPRRRQQQGRCAAKDEP